MDKPYAIFDMDGTLVDSMKYWKLLASEFLQSKGVFPIPPDILERIKPMTMTESSALFVQELGVCGTAQSVAAEMNAMMEHHYLNDIPLKPGVFDYLKSLQQNGVNMCVASATANALMKACLERVGVLKFFEFLLSCEEVGAGKTKPDIYIEAAHRLHAAPGEVAVYEDALYAAATAKEAGFYVIGVYDESALPHWNKISHLADEIIHNF